MWKDDNKNELICDVRIFRILSAQNQLRLAEKKTVRFKLKQANMFHWSRNKQLTTRKHVIMLGVVIRFAVYCPYVVMEP